MINRLSHPEAYAGRRVERVAAGAALLSLDPVLPAYRCVGLDVADPVQFRALLRQAITANRRSFADQPSTPPDLLDQVRTTFDRAGRGEFFEAFRDWLAKIFVYGPDDYRDYSVLQDLLLRARRDHGLLNELGIPAHGRPALLRNLANRVALSCLHDTYKDDDNADLSEWDAEVYARMRFYDEFRSPYQYLSLTCDWIDFVPVVRTLTTIFDEHEQTRFMERVKAAALRLGTFSGSFLLPPLNGLDPADA